MNMSDFTYNLDDKDLINDNSRDLNSLNRRISKLEKLLKEEGGSYREKQRSYTKLGNNFKQAWKSLLKARDLIQDDDNLSIEKNSTYDKVVSMINELDSLIDSCYNY